MDALLDFIARAHQHTYAAPNDVRKAHRCAQPLLANHKEYAYTDGEYSYRDMYAGSLWAPGREVVFHKENPVWCMAYQGKHNASYDSDFFENQVFPFLKRALRQPDAILRGPEEFSEDKFTYTFSMIGDYRYFTGKERVFYGDILVFWQDVMGSLIL